MGLTWPKGGGNVSSLRQEQTAQYISEWEHLGAANKVVALHQRGRACRMTSHHSNAKRGSDRTAIANLSDPNERGPVAGHGSGAKRGALFRTPVGYPTPPSPRTTGGPRSFVRWCWPPPPPPFGATHIASWRSTRRRSCRHVGMESPLRTLDSDLVAALEPAQRPLRRRALLRHQVQHLREEGDGDVRPSPAPPFCLR